MSANPKSAVIPFGKYRGQPLEVLEKDPEYLNWLTNQDWFRNGHANLYQVVINNFAEPCDTPEHNQMQARFLGVEFRLDFVAVITKYEIKAVRKPTFETGGVDVEFRYDFQTPSECEPCPKCTGKHFWQATKDSEPKCRTCTVRPYSYYSDLSAEGWRDSEDLRIEIKPSVGDDFPSVMRQMKRSNANILFIREYCGSGIDEKQFVEMFSSQEIRVVFEREIRC